MKRTGMRTTLLLLAFVVWALRYGRLVQKFPCKLFSCKQWLARVCSRALAVVSYYLRGRCRGSGDGDQLVSLANDPTRSSADHQAAAASWAPALSMKSCPPAFVGLTPESVERLRKNLDLHAEIEQTRKAFQIGPSLCAVIVDEALPFLHRAGCDWDEDSIFRIYSMTKPILAVGFLTLVEQGLVRLDDYLDDYLPCFRQLRVLGPRARGSSVLLEQVKRVLFEPTIDASKGSKGKGSKGCKGSKGSKALAAARFQGALREDGWVKLSFLLKNNQWEHLHIHEDVAVELLTGMGALEIMTDNDGCRWVRRQKQAVMSDLIAAGVPADYEEPRRRITLRMLLTHTVGFGYDFSLYTKPPTVTHQQYSQLAKDAENGPVPDLATWIERLAQIPLLFHPGEEFKYGYSFDVLGRVAEVVTGMNLDDFLQRTVLKPLGMHDTSFAVPVSKLSRLVPLLRHQNCAFKDAISGPFLDEGCPSSRWVEGRQSRVFSGGGAVEIVAGGLVSTLRDYVKLIEMILRGGRGPDGTQILRAETIDVALDGRQLSLATDGAVVSSAPGRSFCFLGEASATGLVCWGGTAGTFFAINRPKSYALAFFAQSFAAPKIKALFEDGLFSKLD